MNKENMLQEMKKICKNSLILHLKDKVFNKALVKDWGNAIMNEITAGLIQNYPLYGYGICFYMSDTTPYVSSDNSVFYPETDLTFVTNYNTDNFYSEIRVI